MLRTGGGGSLPEPVAPSALAATGKDDEGTRGRGVGGPRGCTHIAAVTALRGPRRLCLSGTVEPAKELQLIKHYF